MLYLNLFPFFVSLLMFFTFVLVFVSVYDGFTRSSVGFVSAIHLPICPFYFVFFRPFISASFPWTGFSAPFPLLLLRFLLGLHDFFYPRDFYSSIYLSSSILYFIVCSSSFLSEDDLFFSLSFIYCHTSHRVSASIFSFS